MVDNPEMAACRILALDDHAIQVKIFQKILESYGYTNVVGLNDPRQCLELHQIHPFDLVIIDLNMPGLDGFEVMSQLMDFAGNDFLPMIVVTSSSDRKDMLHALQAGARDFVSRPVHREELIYRVSHLLQVKLTHRKLPSALRPKGARIERNALRRGRILVLDNDPANRVMVEKLLRFGSYVDVTGLEDPTLLASLLESQPAPFDLVILDLHLKEMETREVIRVIQEAPGKTKPYIMAITSDDTNEVRWEAFRAGVWDFVNKPLEREIFLAKVANLVELRLLA